MPPFDEPDLATQHALIRCHPLGLICVAAPTPGDAPRAYPVPFTLDDTAGPQGTLRAHLARRTPATQDLLHGATALVIFQGPAGYVSPSWYATKQSTGKVVPTWNYSLVKVHGTLRFIEDEGYIRRQLAALTRQMENPRSAPWAMDDAPEAYITALVRGLIGLEIVITEITGTAKMSQNKTDADRLGVVAGLTAEGQTAHAALVRHYLDPSDEGGLPTE